RARPGVGAQPLNSVGPRLGFRWDTLRGPGMNEMSRASRGRTVALSALLGSLLTVLPVPAAMHAIAADNPKATYLDLEAETDSGTAGTTFGLTATVYDQFGELFTRSNVNVKLWWLGGP